MKFPVSRTEIIDTVAGIALKSDEKHGSVTPEAKREMRFALMFWNDVEDKTIPAVEYEGVDFHMIDHPASQFEHYDFTKGFQGYIDARQVELVAQLEKFDEFEYTEAKYLDLENATNFDYLDAVIGADYNREQTGQALEALGCTMMNRKLTFVFDNFNADFKEAGLDVASVKSAMTSKLEAVELDDVVDFRAELVYPNSHNDEQQMHLTIWCNTDNVVQVEDQVVDMIKQKREEFDFEDVSVTLRSEHTAKMLPGHKDYQDYKHRQEVARDVERKKALAKEPDFSVMNP